MNFIWASIILIFLIDFKKIDFMQILTTLTPNKIKLCIQISLKLKRSRILDILFGNKFNDSPNAAHSTNWPILKHLSSLLPAFLQY